MTDMQAEFNRHFPSLNVRMLGINEWGHEIGNGLATADTSLPWLQDVDANNNRISDVTYEIWQVAYRDVVVVNASSQETGRYNLTTNNLGLTANYNVLKQMVIDAAKTPPATAWQSPIEPLDVNNDGRLAANDALLIINALALRTYPNGQLPNLGGATPTAFFDVNGDNLITAQDALIIINHLTLSSQPQAALSSQVTVGADEDSDEALALDVRDSYDVVLRSTSNGFDPQTLVDFVDLGRVSEVARSTADASTLPLTLHQSGFSRTNGDMQPLPAVAEQTALANSMAADGFWQHPNMTDNWSTRSVERSASAEDWQRDREDSNGRRWGQTVDRVFAEMW